MLRNTYLRDLPQLDESVPQFSNQLSDVLGREDFDEQIHGLETNDLTELVEYLDKVPSPYQLYSSPAEPSVGAR